MPENFADRVARLCLEKFDSLPTKGKPIAEKEWTLLAGVVQLTDNDSGGRLEVVSLATGTKCIGESKLCPKGTVINDSHAEVLARRALLHYLLQEIELAFQGQPSIFVSDQSNFLENPIRSPNNPTYSSKNHVYSFKKPIFSLKTTSDSSERTFLTLRSDVTFHFFCSHTPCGDASIFPKDQSDLKVPEKQLISDDCTIGEPYKKIRKIDGNDIHRTGAKCLSDEVKQDLRLPGMDYHVIGAVRTKPGRGDRTLSVSCSDKLLRWNSSGVQGALLSLLVEPVYFKSLTIGSGCPYSKSALRRAVINRTNFDDDLCNQLAARLEIDRSTLEFKFAKHLLSKNHKPCPASIVWWKGCNDNGYHEVLVNGRKQGATKKMMDKLSGSSMLCKKSLLDVFKHLWQWQNDDCNNVTYAQLKFKAESYQRQWMAIRSKLGCWTVKPKGMLEFV